MQTIRVWAPSGRGPGADAPADIPLVAEHGRRDAAQGTVSAHVFEQIRSNHDDLAYGFSLVEAIEAQIDVVELQMIAHQPVDRQLAATIKLDVARQVAARHASADVAALDRALLGDQVDLRQRRRCGSAAAGRR